MLFELEWNSKPGTLETPCTAILMYTSSKFFMKSNMLQITNLFCLFHLRVCPSQHEIHCSRFGSFSELNDVMISVVLLVGIEDLEI